DVPDVIEWVRRRPEQGEWCVRHFVVEHLARLWQLHYNRNAIRLWAADWVETFRPGTCPRAAADARYWLHFSAALRRKDGAAPRTPRPNPGGPQGDEPGRARLPLPGALPPRRPPAIPAPHPRLGGRARHGRRAGRHAGGRGTGGPARPRVRRVPGGTGGGRA